MGRSSKDRDLKELERNPVLILLLGEMTFLGVIGIVTFPISTTIFAVQTESEIWNSRRINGGPFLETFQKETTSTSTSYLHTETQKSGVPGSDFLKFSPG